MLKDLPIYIPLGFFLIVLTSLILLYQVLIRSKLEKIQRRAKFVLLGIVIWLSVQAYLGYIGFYSSNTMTLPPRMMLILLPPSLVMPCLFLTSRGRAFIDSLSLLPLTLIHLLRLPIELILYGLALYKFIPELMTFEGRNFDILVGLTAPLVAYFGFVKPRISFWGLVLWNVFSFALLINIMVNGILSAPSILQQFAFEQPNVAVYHFPFCWLPAFMVPLILFSHMASFRLLRQMKTASEFNAVSGAQYISGE